MTLYCKTCNVQVSKVLAELSDDSELCFEDGQEMIKEGQFFVSKGDEFDVEVGNYIVNIKDLTNTKLTNDLSRLNGCCGLDGHEIGTKRTDCWMPYHAIISEKRTRLS